MAAGQEVNGFLSLAGLGGMTGPEETFPAHSGFYAGNFGVSDKFTGWDLSFTF
jgi:hypothetical protein